MTSERKLLVLECNIDDMNPEFYPFIIDGVLELGARDAWLTPIIMKGGRPAQLFSVLLDEAAKPQILEFVFAQTTTLGVRWNTVVREELERKVINVETAFGHIPVKVAYAADGSVLNAAPEYRACAEAARANAIPVKEVYTATLLEFCSGQRLDLE